MTDEVGRRPDLLFLQRGSQQLSVVARRSVAFVLDLVITAYTLGLLVWLATGGVDFGLFSLTGADKPVLVLLIAIPARISLGERTWLMERVRRRIANARSLIRSQALAQVPPAMIDVAFALAATRAASFFIGFIANLLFGRPGARAFEMPFTTEKFAEIFAAWDSGWYFDIARRGYFFDPDGQSSIAFFPLYPTLMTLAAWPFGGTDQAIWAAGIGVSCVAFALALLAIHRLTEQIFGDRETARRTVLYMAVFPFSLFFTRVYAESVLLLMSALAIGRAYNGCWWQAGLWGALATLARPNGILVALPLVFLALRARPTARELVHRAAALSLVPAALAGYCVYVYGLSGDLLGWLSTQEHWNYSIGHPPWQQLLKMIGRIERYGIYDYFFVSAMAPFRLFHGVAALMFLALTPAVFKRLGLPLGTYVLVSLLVPLSGDALEGVGRYTAVLFPVFMVVGSVKSVRVHESILIAASLFLALFVCLFVTVRPIY